MGASVKKKQEKKKDFQKPKLKVGKARPKNTNATDTSFAAKSVVFKQQSLSETGRDPDALFQHNLSLLNSKNETQRRDALSYLTTVCSTKHGHRLPQPPSVVIARAQSLILDGNAQVRQQVLKLLRSLPVQELASLDSLVLYARAGMAHLSKDICASALDLLDWLLRIAPSAIVSSSGGWVKILRAFQNLLSWHGDSKVTTLTTNNGTWSNTRPAAGTGHGKLLVHQLTTLSQLLTVGLSKPSLQREHQVAAKRAAGLFPVWHMDAHTLSRKSNPYGYLNLFGAPRDAEGEVYEEPEARIEVFTELGLHEAFAFGVSEAKKEGGEVGRAAATVDKALKLADVA